MVEGPHGLLKWKRLGTAGKVHQSGNVLTIETPVFFHVSNTVQSWNMAKNCLLNANSADIFLVRVRKRRLFGPNFTFLITKVYGYKVTCCQDNAIMMPVQVCRSVRLQSQIMTKQYQHIFMENGLILNQCQWELKAAHFSRSGEWQTNKSLSRSLMTLWKWGQNATVYGCLLKISRVIQKNFITKRVPI